jgi:membrane associated rhomboid family serine protease
MLIPYNSDAPLYHPPIATVGLIVVNTLLYFVWPPNIDITSGPWPDWRMLYLGHGIWPWQWVTANFMHADFLHLLGNMIFLWGIGIVVEGKLGWKLFLGLYIAIGTIGYGLVQVLCLFGDPNNALGASLPIYGIMVLALLWAPLNNLSCWLMIGLRPTLWEVPIAYFVGGYIVVQGFIFFLTGMHVGSEALHLIGALVAFPFGWYMLTRKLVDCEDYDVISVWKGRHELTRDERREIDEAQPEYRAKIANQRDAFLAQINAILKEQRNPALAWAAHLKAVHRFADWQLPEPTERAIIDLFIQQNKLEEAMPAISDYLRRTAPVQSVDLRIKLAERMITQAERPRQGIKLLAPLATLSLNYNQKLQRDKLLVLAEEKKREIEIEEPTEDW